MALILLLDELLLHSSSFHQCLRRVLAFQPLQVELPEENAQAPEQKEETDPGRTDLEPDWDAMARDVLAWQKQAEAGEATSAAPDALKTPSPRPYLPLPGSTPAKAKVPEPMRKRILAADLKLIKELRKVGMSEDEIKKYQVEKENKRQIQEMEKVEKEKAKVEKQRLRDEKAREKVRKQLEKEEKTTKNGENKGEKTKKKESNGPMSVALKAFVDAQRQAGIGYIQAMRLWKQSDERAEILALLPESERKRRRY